MSSKVWVPLALGSIAVLAAIGLLGPDGGTRPRIVVLISIDTLRPDHLGAYGYSRNTSPRLDALAAEGATFEDVSSPAPWTLPAHGSMLTGLYPSRHGLVTHERYLPASISTLASVFSKQGFRTAAVVNSHNLSPRYGLDRGFQLYRYVEETVERVDPTSEIVDQAIKWVRESGTARLFLFVHTYDAHSDYRSRTLYEDDFVQPYDGPADGTTAQLITVREGKLTLGTKDAAHLVDRYDAGIRQVDDEMERLFAFLRQNSLLDETLMIVTSDHGEEFLEHGGFLHGRTQYQEVVRVPLLMRGPGIPRGTRVKEAVSLLDVMPTVFALSGLSVPPGLDGLDVSPLLERETRGPGLLSPTRRGSGPGADRIFFGEADHNNAEPDVTRVARRRTYVLHYDRLTKTSALYDLATDPGEHQDVAARQPGVADQLLREILRFMETRPEVVAPTDALTPEQLEKLRSLGYLR